MKFSPTARNLMLDALDESVATGAKFGSLHTAYSATGTNEATGGSPAYARRAVTWAAASAGAKAGTVAVPFDVPAGTTVRWVGFFDAASSGTFLGMTPNGGGIPEAFEANAAAVTTNTLDAPGHGFAAGNSVVVWAVPGVSLPTPLAEGTVYSVIATGLTADTLQLSLTSGGSAIDILAVGSGMLQKMVEEIFGAQGTLAVTSAALSLD